MNAAIARAAYTVLVRTSARKMFLVTVASWNPIGDDGAAMHVGRGGELTRMQSTFIFLLRHNWRRSCERWMRFLTRRGPRGCALVSRFRSSPQLAARSDANFGIKGTLALY